MKPALSCIIAVYNRPDFLEKIFVSLLRQTHRDFEVVIADDGSGPEIAALVKQYFLRFGRPIVHVRHEDQGFRKSCHRQQGSVGRLGRLPCVHRRRLRAPPPVSRTAFLPPKAPYNFVRTQGGLR